MEQKREWKRLPHNSDQSGYDMAKIINVIPKDIYVSIEFPIEELKVLKQGIGLADIDYDGKDPVQRASAEAVTSFYKLLEEFLKDVENGS